MKLVCCPSSQPWLTWSLMVTCRLVSGTSLVAVVSTALASSYTYLSHGVVDTAAALLVSCCAVLTAPLGANLTATLNARVSPSCHQLAHTCMASAMLQPDHNAQVGPCCHQHARSCMDDVDSAAVYAGADHSVKFLCIVYCAVVVLGGGLPPASQVTSASP